MSKQPTFNEMVEWAEKTFWQGLISQGNTRHSPYSVGSATWLICMNMSQWGAEEERKRQKKEKKNANSSS